MKKELTFENALEDLEKIVVSLENGELPLDNSLDLFKKGVELTKFCNKKLEQAERKITILLQNENGDLVEEEFGRGV
jgi:exodeoxyribonuclease VII small subunit